MSSSDASDAPAVVLVVGSEATLRSAAIEELRERVLGDGPRDFNEDRYDLASAGTDPAAAIGAARMAPMMAPGRLVWVRGLDQRRADKFIDPHLLGYLEDPVPSTCLVLEAPRVDKRKKWVKQVAKAGKLIDCAPPTRPADVRRWIETRMRERGKKPGRGAAAALAESVGNEIDLLASEIDKLCLYVGEAPEIGADDVAAISGQLRPRAVYELTDALGERRLTQSLEMLSRLIAQGDHPLAILGALANHLRRLIRTRECRPLEASAVQKRLGVHPYAAQKLVAQARSFDLRRLRFCLDAIRRTDDALKGGVAVAPRLAIERLVLAICS